MKNTNLIKGLAIGMAVGGMAYLLTSDCMKSTRKTMKKSANRVLKKAQDVIDDVSYMLK